MAARIRALIGLMQRSGVVMIGLVDRNRGGLMTRCLRLRLKSG